jgi:hypothetical protein
LGGVVVVGESFWVLEDGEVHVQLQKASVAETWTCACKGISLIFTRTTADIHCMCICMVCYVGHGALNEVEAQEVQQKILLERFSREVYPHAPLYGLISML